MKVWKRVPQVKCKGQKTNRLYLGSHLERKTEDMTSQSLGRCATRLVLGEKRSKGKDAPSYYLAKESKAKKKFGVKTSPS